MAGRKKRIIGKLLWILLVAILAGFAFLMLVRAEFIRYLEAVHPEETFSVGFAKIDPLYEKFWTETTCLDDNTEFSVSKSWNTKRLSDNYSEVKSQNGYNSMISGLFAGKEIHEEIVSATGSGKRPFDGSGYYEQVNFHLADEKEHAKDIKTILGILEDKGIFAERIIFSYEKDGHVYRLSMSSKGYILDEEEIENRIEMIK